MVIFFLSFLFPPNNVSTISPIKPNRTKNIPPSAVMRFTRIIFLDLWFYFAHSSLLVVFYNDSVKLPSWLSYWDYTQN